MSDETEREYPECIEDDADREHEQEAPEQPDDRQEPSENETERDEMAQEIVRQSELVMIRPGGTRAEWLADVVLTSDWLAVHDRKLVEATVRQTVLVVDRKWNDNEFFDVGVLDELCAAILAEFKIGGEHKHPEVSNRPVTVEMATRVRLSAATVGELLEAGWTYREAINEPDTWTRPGIADLRRTDKIGGETL